MIQKYRAWHIKEKEMMGILSMEFDGERLVTLVCLSPKRMADDPRVPCELNDVVLMQSTGLKDKNNKEIFEGDIVAHIDIGGVIEIAKSGERIIRHKSGNGTTLFFDNRNERIVVIGNIYENPELLEDVKP